MKYLIRRYKPYLKNKQFLYSTALGFLMLFASVIINFYAGMYATERASSPVTDIILSNTKVYDVDGIFVYGVIVFAIFVMFVCLEHPKRIPFVLKSVSLFVLIRSLFITLTHIGPYPAHIMVHSNILSWFTFGGDLFFSGHTGLPFLLALVFWDYKYLRYLFILSSLVFGVVVLLGHLHYTIDVLAAFFITYTIYHIACYIFKEDRALFAAGLE